MQSLPSLFAAIAHDGGRHLTATAFVEASLRTAILSGRLPGGTALRQEDLATAFGVSRMPIREALRKLEAQALIDFKPHKGAVVTTISASDAADVYAIRMALEPAIFIRSIPNLMPDDFERAEDLIVEMDSEQDQGRMGELNRRFHMTLYGAAVCPKFLELTESYLVSFDLYLRFHLAVNVSGYLGQDEHRAMLAAAKRRDTLQAVEILQTHINTAAQAIQAFLNTRD